MLIWVAAMHCEAKPVIDFYRLKKLPEHHAFDLYQNDKMICIISGIGKVAVAAACAWVAALNREQASMAWINIGIAGSAQDAIGTALWINKISDSDTGRSSYPVPMIETTLKPTQCLTLGEASNEYHSQYLFDMEASAFFDTATRFSSAELVQCIKIVSDNQEEKTGRDKVRVSQLVAQNIEPLTQFAQSLQAQNERLAEIFIDPSDWQKFINQAHFTQTQKSELRKSLTFLISQNFNIGKLTDEVSGDFSGTSIVAHLKQLCQQTSRNL